MTQRIISISGAPYDGHPVANMLESIARCGATHVEPAFIVGYTEPFDESSFSAAEIRIWRNSLKESGIGCEALSSHIDLGREDAVEVFLGRMDFAKALGANVINTNAASKDNEARFYKNMEVLARHAEDIGLYIGLENPGDGSENLLNTAAEGPSLLEKINSAFVGLNYDAGNTISHRRDVVPDQDAILAMPLCKYTHIKDVAAREDGFYFSQLGQGQVGCERILKELATTSLNLSIEMPLRLHRKLNAQPVRATDKVDIAEIEAMLKPALSFVRQHLTPA